MRVLAFAPASMVMKLSPHTRVIMATPVGQLSERVMYSHVTPCSARLAIIWSPNASAPTAPSMHTAAPIFAAATAWFAPLPPGLVMKPRPIMVSPKLGMWSLSMDKSIFKLPNTMTLLIAILRNGCRLLGRVVLCRSRFALQRARQRTHMGFYLRLAFRARGDSDTRLRMRGRWGLP